MREIVLDTETTGLNFSGGDRVIEIGCVELINHVSTNNTLQFYCKVEKEISKDAQKISGITNKFLEDKKTFFEQYLELLDFIRDDALIIHNADFDIGFINNEFKIIGKEGLKNKVIDTVPLARKTLNTRIANLDYLCRYFNIDLSKRKLHGALLDAQLLAEVYLELKGGKQFSMDLATKKHLKTEQKENKNKTNLKIPKKRISDEDLNLHKRMVKNIKDPIWSKYDY